MEINRTIYDQIFKTKNFLIELAMMVSVVVLLSVLSNIRIPLWPVPVTLQTFGVLLIPFLFGMRKGALTVLFYLLAGIVGLGVFSGGASGISTMFGPTGGYLFGFVICVIVVGKLVERGWGRTRKSVLACMGIGNLIIYFFGLIGLWLYLQTGLVDVLMKGLVPFLIGDAFKTMAAMFIVPAMWKN